MNRALFVPIRVDFALSAEVAHHPDRFTQPSGGSIPEGWRANDRAQLSRNIPNHHDIFTSRPEKGNLIIGGSIVIGDMQAIG